jgi:hypothetical protein
MENTERRNEPEHHKELDMKMNVKYKNINNKIKPTGTKSIYKMGYRTN